MMISPLESSFDPSALGLGLPQEVERQELGQEEFLQLMITQLENQDPFKPLESGEFLGQLAQFGTVSGLAELQGSFDELATSLVSDQALQAASLVGRSVIVETDQGFLEEGGVLTGGVELPIATSALRVQIMDAAGGVVRQIDMGAQTQGHVSFRWAGETDTGQIAPAGRYTVSAQYFNGDDMQSATTAVNAAVESVTIGAGGLSVRLRGLGEVPFSAVREIGQTP